MLRTHPGPPSARLPVPRGLLASPRANTDPKVILAQIAADFDAFKKNHRGEMNGLQDAYDKMAVQMAMVGAGGFSGGADRVEDPAYTQPFASWFRTGAGEQEVRNLNLNGARSHVYAAMSTGSDSNGGYLAPVEWDRKVSKALVPLSPMRRLATVVQTTNRAFSTVWNNDNWGSGWVGETASRPATTTPELSTILFAAGEIYANPTITQQLLDDADFQVENWLAEEVANTFALQEGPAFIAGDGVNKPRGLLTFVDPLAGTHPGGNIAVVNSGSASAITADGLIDLIYAVNARYRQNGTFLMNSITASQIAKLKDGQGQYLWRQSLDAAQPSTLLGFPMAIDETMPSIAAGNVPVVFGDFRAGYLVNDRAGVRVLRDPYSAKPYVAFYSTKRVGGGLRDPKAFRALRISA